MLIKTLGKTTKAIAKGSGNKIATDIVEIIGNPNPVMPCKTAPNRSKAMTNNSVNSIVACAVNPSLWGKPKASLSGLKCPPLKEEDKNIIDLTDRQMKVLRYD